MNTNKKIFSMQWHLTDNCDQACKHCYIYQNTNYLKESKRELSFEEARFAVDNFVSFCIKMNCAPRISITGGDPILYKNFWEIISYIYSKGIIF